uniref:HU family DNA-binding protein n=1 Tax=Prevotella sp. GTC17254 TaxID=3236794 RepID=A0AB33IUS3_9BACT
MKMNSNVFLSEMCKSLEQKFNLDRETAQAFVERMFIVLGDGIRHDKQVKVKGFGTFKTVYVSARESVDVNTGERILIEGRDKLSFSPESGVKELINRPFSQFKTVVVNDGVDTEILSYVETEGNADEPEEVKVSPTLHEEQTEIPGEEPTEQPMMEAPAPIEEAEDIVAVEQEPVSIAEQTGIYSASLEEQPALEEEQEGSTVVRNSKLPVILLSVLSGLFFLLCCFGGYFFMQELRRRDAMIEKLASQLQTKFQKSQPAKVLTAQKKKDMPDSVIKKPVEPVVTQQVSQTGPSKPQSEFALMEQRDVRVRTGAYHIIGVKEVVTAKKGQTLKSISRTYLGPDMECYVEVLNGVKEVRAGDKLKIPELKLKKRK